MNLLRNCLILLALAPPLPLLAEPLLFKSSEEIPGKTQEQIVSLLTDFENSCASGCKNPVKNLRQSVILEKSQDRFLIWQEFKDQTQFREITILRSESQLTLHARFPNPDTIPSLETQYGRIHSTPLTRLDEDWVLDAGKLQTIVTFSGVLDGPLLSSPEARLPIMESYQQSLDETYALLNRPIDVPLFDHALWQALPPSADVFPANENQKLCPAGTWAMEDDAIEIKTGACNFLTLTQPLSMKIPAGTQLRFVMWHSNLSASGPAMGHAGLALQRKIQWQETIAIPSYAKDYEAIITLQEPLAAGDPIDVHIDNHGSNAWTIYSLEWIGPQP